MRALSLLFALLTVFAVHAAEVYTDPATGLHVLSAEVDLPAEGFWFPDPERFPRDILGFTFLLEPDDYDALHRGQRNQALRERRADQERRRLISRAGIALHRNKPDDGAITPAAWQDVELSDYPDVLEAFENGILALIPGQDVRNRNRENPKPLIVELRPIRDDGKHWVRLNTWRLERREIDPGLLDSLGLHVRPDPLSVYHAETMTYTLLARLLDPDLTEFTLTLRNDHPKAKKDIRIAIGGATDSREGFDLWAEERTWSWLDLDSRIARIWVQRAPELYGVDRGLLRTPGFDPGRAASLLNVFGGGAAIRETLQLQNLDGGTPRREEPQNIPIDRVPGVTVRSHDYEILLGDTPAPAVDLARYAPMDRFFIWLPRPAELGTVLTQSEDILARLLTSGTPSAKNHDVLNRHLARLGLTREMLTDILNLDLISDTALLLPDLFLTEGTDVTSLSRLRDPEAIDALFALFDRIGPVSSVHRWRHEDLLVLSSSATELERVKQLVLADGAGSLGTSSEFRYMLTQTPPGDDTLAYIYFSDDFIRRLTGPEVKIAQYRRLHALAELQQLSAGGLLYELDQGRSATDIATLIDSRYAPPLRHLDPEALTWNNGAAADPEWGSAADPSTITERLPAHVTQTEKDAYETYRRQYEQFWQQFFDPIAIHIEQTAEEEFQTTVFILPLINSSLYDTVRQWFDPAPDRPALRRPIISPAPVALMSLNLSEAQWLDIIEGLAGGLEDFFGMDLPVWEFLGPGLHFGLADSDSVLTFGSGDLLEIFSARTGVTHNEMVWLPMMVSLFTRPVVLAVDLTDADAMAAALEGIPTGSLLHEDDFFGFSFDVNRITGRDRWLLRVSFGSVMHLSFSLEVQGEHLVLSNLPLTYHPHVSGVQTDALRDAGILLQPHAIDQTGPGFASAALDRARRQTHRALGTLHVLHKTGCRNLEEAQKTSARLFGFTAVHPRPGEFLWSGAAPESSLFGLIHEGRQPPLESLDLPGLLPPIRHLDVSMQLENEGLRTRFRWKTSQK